MVDSTMPEIRLKPHHVGISVPDLEASVAWYRDKLGFALEKRMDIDAIPAKVVFMKKGDFYIELFEVSGAAPLPDSRRGLNNDLKVHGTKHIALAVENLKTVAGTLKNNGVDFAMDLTEINPGEWACFIRDNSGNLLELVSPWKS